MLKLCGLLLAMFIWGTANLYGNPTSTKHALAMYEKVIASNYVGQSFQFIHENKLRAGIVENVYTTHDNPNLGNRTLLRLGFGSSQYGNLGAVVEIDKVVIVNSSSETKSPQNYLNKRVHFVADGGQDYAGFVEEVTTDNGGTIKLRIGDVNSGDRSSGKEEITIDQIEGELVIDRKVGRRIIFPNPNGNGILHGRIFAIHTSDYYEILVEKESLSGKRDSSVITPYLLIIHENDLTTSSYID